MPLRLLLFCVLALTIALSGPALFGAETPPAQPLVLGETFELRSEILDETRVINVYLPPAYEAAGEEGLPVLYMPDGGIGEDFLHIAGLVQISALNGTMRPHILVGIENTERRRDLTGPTANEKDLEIAPRVGGSAAFRRFLREELMPAVAARYRTQPGRAILGESLAGLFVLETFVLEPDLFDVYIAVDPSLWWSSEGLIAEAGERLAKRSSEGKTVFLASTVDTEIGKSARKLLPILEAAPSLTVHHHPMPQESHGTIFHPAALAAVRTALGPS